MNSEGKTTTLSLSVTGGNDRMSAWLVVQKANALASAGDSQ